MAETLPGVSALRCEYLVDSEGIDERAPRLSWIMESERRGTPALFRKAFEIPSAIRRATVYASARGLFELHIGGQRVGSDVFAPEWTDYNTRIHYRTYDVTALVKAGRNVIEAVLGDGWWSG